MKKLEHPWDLFIKQKVFKWKKGLWIIVIMLRKKRVILQYAISLLDLLFSDHGFGTSECDK